MKPRLELPLALAALALAPHASAEPGVTAASVTWLFGDDDALHAPSDVRPASPAPSAGDRAGYDTLGTGAGSRFTGRENELLLGACAAAPGFVRGVTTRAEVALAVDLSAVGSRPSALVVEDRGTALELGVVLGSSAAAPRLSLRLLPLNADRLRAGWLELLSWGGEVGPHRDSPYVEARTPPRGASLSAEAGPFRIQLGAKTAGFLEPVSGGPAVEETSYGAYGVLEVRSGPLAVGVGAGRFEHGRLAGVRSPPRAVTMGASLRASLGRGLASPRVPDALGLGPVQVTAVDESRAPGWVVALEASTLAQRLRRFDEPGRSVLAPARAVAVTGTVRAGIVEARALLAVRDAAFVMRSVPGVFAGMTLPSSAASRSDALALAGVAFRALSWLEPGVSLGARSPAAVMTASLDALGQPTGATVVVYGPGDVELLPPGEGPVPILEAAGSLRLRLSSVLGAAGFLGWRRDFNRARLEPMPGGAVARAFADPNRLFYGLAARAIW